MITVGKSLVCLCTGQKKCTLIILRESGQSRERGRRAYGCSETGLSPLCYAEHDLERPPQALSEPLFRVQNCSEFVKNTQTGVPVCQDGQYAKKFPDGPELEILPKSLISTTHYNLINRCTTIKTILLNSKVMRQLINTKLVYFEALKQLLKQSKRICQKHGTLDFLWN